MSFFLLKIILSTRGNGVIDDSAILDGACHSFVDFIQWGIHRLLHRVPFLWGFHKVHHSIIEMDWNGSMRFHWLEIVGYRSLQ